MTRVDWDGMNQAARANDARKALDAVLTAFEALADRLDDRAHGPVAPAVSDIYATLSRDLVAVVAEFRGDGVQEVPEPQEPVSRTPADWGTECKDRRCLRGHDYRGVHTS